MAIQESKIGLPNNDKYVGKIVCPICLKDISVPRSHAVRENYIGKPWWNTSGFENHLKDVHKTFNLDEHCKCYICMFYKVCEVVDSVHIIAVIYVNDFPPKLKSVLPNLT